LGGEQSSVAKLPTTLAGFGERSGIWKEYVINESSLRDLV
jgi:hypothetical protein